MANDYRTIVQNLPTTVKGFVYMDSTYEPVIVLNERLTYEQRRKTYRHEADHISNGDLSDMSYIEYQGDAV